MRWLTGLVRAHSETVGEALSAVFVLNHFWPHMRSDERNRLRCAGTDAAGLIERRVARKTGFVVSLYDSVKQGIESEHGCKEDSADYVRGHWQLKYSVVCEEHSTVVCVASIKAGRSAMAECDFCDDCREIMASSAASSDPDRQSEAE